MGSMRVGMPAWVKSRLAEFALMLLLIGVGSYQITADRAEQIERRMAQIERKSDRILELVEQVRALREDLRLHLTSPAHTTRSRSLSELPREP